MHAYDFGQTWTTFRDHSGHGLSQWKVMSSLIGWAHTQRDIWTLRNQSVTCYGSSFVTHGKRSHDDAGAGGKQIGSTEMHHHGDWTKFSLICRAHYNDVLMSAMASQITDVSLSVCLTVCSGAHKRKHQRSASSALRGESTGGRRIPLTKDQ